MAGARNSFAHRQPEAKSGEVVLAAMGISHLYRQDCAFCQMVRGELSTHLVARDDYSLVILDRRPVFLGHCLVIPLDHYETLSDLPDELVGPIFIRVRSVSIAVQRAMHADGTFVAMNNKVSQSVPHLHVHVIPRKMKDGLKGFFWPRQNYASEEQALEIERAIRRELAAIKAS